MEFIAGSIDVKGSVSEKQVWKNLQSFFKNETAGYCGYKKPSISVDIDEVPSFVILVPKYGVVLIDVIDHQITKMEGDYWTIINDETLLSRDILLGNFAREIDTRLSKYSALYNRRESKALLPISTRLIFLQNSQDELESFREILVEKAISGTEFNKLKLENLFSEIEDSKLLPLSHDKYDRALSVLEGTSALGKKQPPLKSLETKNDFIQKSLEETFKLDEVQRQVAMQIADGPQRIRGLAGTGKTVILCLKAAIAHQELPNYKILFLFNTRSMYPQIRELISKYYTREAKQPVNWDNVEVLHAWGGRTEPGLYSSLCQNYNISPVPFRQGLSLENIFAFFLKGAREKLQPVYDLVLIDEAQDLPPSVFETVFYLTKGEAKKKRIVWAYDEFQTLTDVQIKEPKDLFGFSENQKPNLSNSILDGKYGQIDKDYVLSNSYRNPRVVLMVAHGLALGFYRQEGDIECIENKKTWNALGYQVIEPTDRETFVAGDGMVVKRPEEFSKNKLENLLKEHQKKEQKLVLVKSHSTVNEEIDFLVSQIKGAIVTGKIDPTEVIVVTLDTKVAKNDLSLIRQALDRLNIRSTMPGIMEDASVFKEKGTVTLTTPFRAKGNEANVVFVMNAQKVVSDSLLRARNALFVAITRARGWCYISGNGHAMNELENEINAILADYPCFKFQQPSDEEVRRRRTILSRQDDKEMQNQNKNLEKIIQDNPELLIEKILETPAILEAIKKSSHG